MNAILYTRPCVIVHGENKYVTGNTIDNSSSAHPIDNDSYNAHIVDGDSAILGRRRNSLGFHDVDEDHGAPQEVLQTSAEADGPLGSDMSERSLALGETAALPMPAVVSDGASQEREVVDSSTDAAEGG